MLAERDKMSPEEIQAIVVGIGGVARILRKAADELDKGDRRSLVRAKPFVRWAGGKTSSLPSILPALQSAGDKGMYYEPFVGGGAVFFALEPRAAVLGDTNQALVQAFNDVKSDVDLLIFNLKQMRYSEEEYLKRRKMFNDAPWSGNFVYLLKTNFNGLWRVNKKGEYNVPSGKFKKSPTICDEDGLRAASEALQVAMIGQGDFETTLRTAQKGDRAYLDCPYPPASETANFAAYTKSGFGLEDHQRLAACAADLARRGCHVVASNADVPLVRKLYPKVRWNLQELQVARAINSNGAKRGKVGELLITPKKGAF